MPRRSSTPWICMVGDAFFCARCGAKYKPQLPAAVRVFAAMCKEFQKTHARCKPRQDGPVCPHCRKTGHPADECPTLKADDPHAWLRGPDTGMSSLTIWCVMMGLRDFGVPPLDGRPAIPYDAADFGRCYRLLALFPAWRARIAEMRDVAGWAGLVDAWDELEQLYAEEHPTGRCPRLFARMKELRGER